MGVEQLVALNDELEALVRAGVPLERGLQAAARDYRGRLGRAIGDLARRLEAGQGLAEAMAGSAAALPAVYAAVVEAGLRTGRLAEALQGLSRLGLAVVEARRTIALACCYPLLVAGLAYALVVGFAVAISPRFTAAAATLHLDDLGFVAALERAGPSAATWGPIAPLAALVGLVAWNYAGRARALDGTAGLGGVAAAIPGVRRIIANYRGAQFADLLAHLVEHDVPLGRAVALAGEAAGGARLRRAAARLAAELDAGGPVAADGGGPRAGGGAGAGGGIPPLAAWMIAAGHRQGELAAGLRHLGRAYRRRAARQAEALRIILPGVLIVGVGSVVVLAYALVVFVPLRHLWDGLAAPPN